MTAAQFSDDWGVGNEEPTRRIDRTEVGVISVSDAELMRRKIAAWLLDRAEQYGASGQYILEEMAEQIMKREPDEAAAHGELDDLLPIVEGWR